MILKYFGRENDILLLEGNLNEEVPIPLFIFSHEAKKFIPIRSFGWEKDLDTFNKEGMMIKQIHPYLQKYKNASNNAEKIKIEEEMLQLEQNIFIENNKRNVSLVSLIKENMNKYPHSRVFVIAGGAHVLHKKEYDYSIMSLKDGVPTEMYSNIFDFNILEHLPPETRAGAVILKNEFPSLQFA